MSVAVITTRYSASTVNPRLTEVFGPSSRHSMVQNVLGRSSTIRIAWEIRTCGITYYPKHQVNIKIPYE